MKLIIDIPKSIYEYMQTDKYDRHKTEYFEMIIPHSVKDGTPLEEELEKIKIEIDESIHTLNNKKLSTIVVIDVFKVLNNRIKELKGE